MKKVILTLCIGSILFNLPAEEVTIDGVKWLYTSSGTSATITGVENYPKHLVVPSALAGFTVRTIGNSAFGCKEIVSVVLPSTITSIGGDAFIYCYSLESIELPDSITWIDHSAFHQCRSLRHIRIPEHVTQLSYDTFTDCGALEWVEFPRGFSRFVNLDYRTEFRGCKKAKLIFQGACPENILHGNCNIGDVSAIFWSEEFGGSWMSQSLLYKFGGFVSHLSTPSVEVSSVIRNNDGTVLDVVYKVTSSKPKVKVRVLAFEDGERSFAKVVRPETFIEGTEVNVGDNITPNVEHRLSWRVSSDWTTKLAKVKFEVLAMEENLVPLELMTIPASDQYGAMKISWNAISDAQLFDALLWLTASKDSALSFSSGVLRANGTNVAQNTGFANNTQREAAASFIFGKMGCQRMTGAILNYANQETRLGLSPSGSRQYAYKMVP